MSGHTETHLVSDAAKAWLEWFEKAGVLPEAVQAHKEHEAEAEGGQQHAGSDPGGQGLVGAAAGGKAGDVAGDRKLLGKLAAEWHRAEEQARAGVRALKAELDKLYDGDPAAAQMEKDFAVHVDAIFAKFDGTLAKDVQAAASARTAAEMDAVKADLKRAVSGLIDFLEHDSILLMDENPLVDIKIVPTCEAALKSMLASLG